MAHADLNGGPTLGEAAEHGRESPLGRNAFAAGSASDDRMDLAQLWVTLRNSTSTIAIVAALVFCLVAALTLVSRMDFRSSGRLYLGELDGKAEASGARTGELDLSGGEPGDLGSEIQILQSESLVTRAILDSGLNVTITPSNWRAPRYWQWLVERRNPKLLDVAARELAAVDTSLVDNFRGAQDYKVKFVSDTDYQVWSGQAQIGKGKLGEPTVASGLRLTLLRGSQRAPRAGALYDLRVAPLDEVTRDVSKALGVSVAKPITQGEPTKVVSLEFVHASPLLSATFLEKLMRGYLDARQSWKTEDASAAEAFVTKQLESMRESLERTEKSLADYRSNTRVVVLDNEAKAMIEQIGKYEEQRVAARLEVAGLADMKRALNNPNARMEAYLLGEADDSVLEGLAASLSVARQELASLEGRFNAAAPDVRQQRAQVDAQLAVIKNYVSNRFARAQENLGALSQIIGQFEDKLKTVPGAELGLAQLARESEVYSKMYSYLLERQQQAAIVKASTVSKNRILDLPQVPYREHSPKLGLRLAIALLGVLLGMGLVVLRGVFASTLQSEGDVLRSTGGRPIIASIPRRPLPRSRRRAGPGPLSHDVLAEDPHSAFAEAFRMLRASLYHQAGAERGKVILVTSPTPGDGKTTCVLSLASMLAADRKQVLVVDADLRKPTHHLLMGTPEQPGLGNVLSGQCGWRTLAHAVPLAIGGLYSISAGDAVPADLLSSAHLADMLADARTRFDFVLLDAPSFPLVSDPLVLCAHADCVLSVLRLQATPRKLATDHVRRLSAAAPSYCVVVNDIGSVQAYGPGSSYPRPKAKRAARGGRAAWLTAGVVTLGLVGSGLTHWLASETTGWFAKPGRASASAPATRANAAVAAPQPQPAIDTESPSQLVAPVPTPGLTPPVTAPAPALPAAELAPRRRGRSNRSPRVDTAGEHSSASARDEQTLSEGLDPNTEPAPVPLYEPAQPAQPAEPALLPINPY